MPEERKLVTIVFADVTGSTSMGEELDPEDLRALMGRYYDHARRVVEDHGGTLEKFIGDAVMAVFGLPHVHDNDAERALAAALALREAVATDQLLGGRLALRIGVNTGEVMATSGHPPGRAGDDFLVTGDAVNVAARLQQAAAPGQILAGERTRLAGQAGFRFGEAEDLDLKGKQRAVRAFAVIEALAERRRFPEGSTRSEFVGREQDLAQLLLLRDRAREERRPQLVSIVAPAGTGKSRLLEEFLARLDPADGFRVGTAKCLPYGQTLTYWPLRGLLESLLGGPPGKAEVAGAFILAGSEPADADRLGDHVLATLGVETGSSTAQAERETVFNAWRLLTESLARRSPLIVVFEDLHWASDSLLDLVEHIMQPRTAAPLVIVALSRPELLDRRPGWGGGRRSFTNLALDPLTHDQTVQLVGAASRPLPPAIRDRIAERSGGNPFFALELVRGLAERGIGADQSQAEAAAAQGLPDTVHAAVLARLDLLSPVERRVVQAASVAGRAFRTPALTALLADLPERDIENAIDELLVRDLIAPTDGGAFTFRHILTRDVAYGMLSRNERIRMHSATAAWLEEFAAGRTDEFVELIAYHYREAAILARRSAILIDVPHETEQAVFYLERAGRVAGAAGGFAEAAEHLRNAIELAPEADRARLYEVTGDAAPFGDSAITAYKEALDRWRDDGEREPLVGARLMRKLISIYMRWLGSVSTRPSREEMIAMRREAWRLAELAGDEAEKWRLKTANLFWYFWSSELPAETTDDVLGADEAMEVAEAAAGYFEDRGEWETFHAILDASSGIAHHMGDQRLRASIIERRLAAPHTSRLDEGDALNMRAWAYSDAGEFDRAIDLMRDAATKLRPGEPIAHLGNGLALATFAAMISGRWSDVDELKVLLDQSWEELRHGASAAYLSAGFGSILHVGLAREDRAMADSALAVLRPLVDFADRHHLSVFVEACVRDDPSVLDSIGEEHGGPVMFFIVPFRLERGVIPSSMTVEAIRDHAAHPARIGEVYLAIAEAMHVGDVGALASAIETAEAAGLTPHAARMRIVLARLSGDPGPLEPARSALTALGDRQFLARLEEVEAALGVRSSEPSTQRSPGNFSTKAAE